MTRDVDCSISKAKMIRERRLDPVFIDKSTDVRLSRTLLRTFLYFFEMGSYEKFFDLGFARPRFLNLLYRTQTYNSVVPSVHPQ